MPNEMKWFSRGGFMQVIAIYLSRQAYQGFRHGYLTQGEKESLQNWASRVYQTVRL